MGKGSIRSSIQQLSKFFDGLTKAQENALKQTCFGHFLMMNHMKSVQTIITILLTKHKPILTFTLGGVELKFSLADLAIILGLKCVEKDKSSLTKPRDESHKTFKDRFFPKVPKVTKKDLLNAMKDIEISPDDHLRLSLLYILATFLLPNGNDTVQPDHLDLVDDLNAFNSFPWGLIVYKDLASAMITAAEVVDKPSYNIYGCVYALQVWVYERIPDCRPSIKEGDSWPRAMRWLPDIYYHINSLQQSFEKEDLQVLMEIDLSEEERKKDIVTDALNFDSKDLDAEILEKYNPPKHIKSKRKVEEKELKVVKKLRVTKKGKSINSVEIKKVKKVKKPIIFPTKPKIQRKITNGDQAKKVDTPTQIPYEKNGSLPVINQLQKKIDDLEAELKQVVFDKDLTVKMLEEKITILEKHVELQDKIAKEKAKLFEQRLKFLEAKADGEEEVRGEEGHGERDARGDDGVRGEEEMKGDLQLATYTPHAIIEVPNSIPNKCERNARGDDGVRGEEEMKGDLQLATYTPHAIIEVPDSFPNKRELYAHVQLGMRVPIPNHAFDGSPYYDPNVINGLKTEEVAKIENIWKADSRSTEPPIGFIGYHQITNHTIQTLRFKGFLKKYESIPLEGWIDCDVVNAYLVLMKDREHAYPKTFPKCHYFTTYFLELLERVEREWNVFVSTLDQPITMADKVLFFEWGKASNQVNPKVLKYNIMDCTKAFIPLCIDKHWALAILHIKDKKVVVVDSLKQKASNRYTQHFKRLLHLLPKILFSVGAIREFVESWCDWQILDYPKPPKQMNGDDCGIFMLKYIDCLCKSDKIDEFSSDQCIELRYKIAASLLFGVIKP